MNLIFLVFISIPKSLYFNLKYFPVKTALHFPVLINYRTELKTLKGKIILPSKSSFGLVKIGFSGSYALGGGVKSYFENEGLIEFGGKATFSRGTQIIVGEKGILRFGADFRCNSNCIFNARTKISFGDDCLLSWDITLMDSDGHTIINLAEGSLAEQAKNISIGSHVWICSGVTILKGVYIGNHTIIAAGSIITKRIDGEHILIGGHNKILKREIDWEV